MRVNLSRSQFPLGFCNAQILDGGRKKTLKLVRFGGGRRQIGGRLGLSSS